MDILNTIDKIKKINGYLGAAIFSKEGKMLGGVTEVLGMSFEVAGTLFNNVFILAKNLSIESGFGDLFMLQLNSEKGIVLSKSFTSKQKTLTVVLVIKNNSSANLAKIELDRIIKSL